MKIIKAREKKEEEEEEKYNGLHNSLIEKQKIYYYLKEGTFFLGTKLRASSHVGLR